jgi:UDP-galactose transporter B1
MSISPTKTFIFFPSNTIKGVGVALFGSKSSHKVATKLQAANVPLGYGLCLLNLAFDGYTNAAQDEIIKKHPRSPPIHMMCW